MFNFENIFQNDKSRNNKKNSYIYSNVNTKFSVEVLTSWAYEINWL